MLSARVELALEALAEDESLTTAAEDPAADALLRWAEAQIVLADTSAPSDAAFDERVAAVKAAVRGAARSSAGRDVSQVVASAADALPPASAASRSVDAEPELADNRAEHEAEATTNTPPANPESIVPPAAPAAPRTWRSLRQRLRRWFQLEV